MAASRRTLPPSRHPLRYTPALDGLRGVAVLCVLVFHLGRGRLEGGFLGVDLFFVLSGFLITSLLLQEVAAKGGIDFRTFFLKRALRLLPVVVAMLLAVWAFGILTGVPLATNMGGILRTGGAAIGYVANWVMALGSTEWPFTLHHLWSLAIEEQFYLVWPVLCALVLWKRPSYVTLAGVAAAIALASALWRWHMLGPVPSFARLYFATDTRADGLLIGCAAGALVARFGAPRSRLANAVALVAGIVAVGIVASASMTSPWMYSYGFISANLACAGLIVAGLSPGWLAAGMSARPLVQIGRISYGLYVWHWPVYLYLDSLTLYLGAGAYDAVKVILTALVSVLSYLVIEAPALKLKRHLTHRASRKEPSC